MNLVNLEDMMASRDVNVERIEFEVKKKLLLSIAGLATYQEKCCSSLSWSPISFYDSTYKPCRYKTVFHNDENAAWKTLMAQLPVYCKNKSNGCQEILMKEDMIKHEQGCLLTPPYCPDLNCTQRSTYHGLMKHVTQVHKGLDVIEKEKFVITSKIDASLKPQKLATTRISAFDFTFFEVGVITNQHMFKWIYILADPDVAKNFHYQVIVKINGGEVEMAFNNQVRSLSEHYNDITKSFKAFFMPIAKVKEFLGDDSQMVLEYRIRNMKEEAKDDNQESGISDNDE